MSLFVLLHLLLWPLLSGDCDSIQTASTIVFPRIHLILCFVTFLVFLIQSDNLNITSFLGAKETMAFFRCMCMLAAETAHLLFLNPYKRAKVVGCQVASENLSMHNLGET